MKSIRFTFIISFLVLAAIPYRLGAQNTRIDLNGDGYVDVGDVTNLIQTVLNGGNGPVINPLQGHLSAKTYGAVGDGVTDDTQALERLFEDAYNAHKAVFFEPGTYLIRRSLTLRTGMEIYGDGATITKPKAITTKLTAAAAKGQTYLDVEDATGFREGDQFFIEDAAGANYCTYGIVTSVEGNRIHFYNIISDHQSNFPGCVRAYASGLNVSKSFALLRSWGARFECDGVYIHHLTLDGNRDSSEPKSWANSCIHLDSYYGGGYTGSTGIEYRTVQRNLVAKNLIIRNSPHDAISDQGEGGLIVQDCTIENSAMHGVHLGTIYSNALIYNNIMTGNWTIGSGVFCCQSVTNVIVDGNVMMGFNHGCSDEEFGTCGKFLIIRNNAFHMIVSHVFDFLKASSSSRGGGIHIYNNEISGMRAAMFSGRYLDDVIIAGNKVTQVSSAPANLINVTQSNNVIISGNTLPSGVNISQPVVSTGTTNILQNANSWN